MKEVKKLRKKRSEKGFTLVELMIVIAIIAILAAVAISQYSAYKNKAKAKELLGFARACAMEIVSQCEVEGNGASVSTANLDACSNPSDTKYLTSISVSVASSVTCGNDFDVTATATIKGTNKKASVTCSFNANTNDISCGVPTIS